MAERKAPDRLVVIGASAGGIDALSTLAASIPDDFPAPIIVAQHLDPRHPSHLPEILARHTRLRVRTVAKRQRLSPGSLYVVPSQRHVAVSDGHARLVEDDRRRPQPSIDLLLSTAAEAYGEHVTAVILTGSGSDGAEGARRVKAAGGTVIVQDPDTAQFPSMPRSLAPTTVDIVTGLESIGQLLVDLMKEPIAQRRGQGSHVSLESFLGRLRDESGIDFASYKRPTILRRLQRRMAATGSADLDRYAEHLWNHPDELQRLTGSFLLKVTEFFRDPALFERLRGEWLPELVADASRRGEELRVWSAGCATGEEAYSVAMLVAEAATALADPPPTRIFATDLDDAAVAFARRGIYPAAAFENVPADLRERFVNVLDGEAELTKELRSLVVFGQHDLGQRAPFPRIDLVLCRNVLIYFQTDLQRRALELFAFALRDGGLLVLGKAETTAATRGSFALVDRALKVYRRAGPRAALPSLHVTQPARPEPLVPSRPVAPALDLAVMRARREAEATRAGADRANRVLLGLQTGVVVVDERYDIVRINAAAREMLSIHGTAIGDDFVHLAVGLPSTDIRGMIDSALGGEPAQGILALGTTAAYSGAKASLAIQCTGLASDEHHAASVVIELRDVTDVESERAGLQAQVAAREAELAQMRGAHVQDAAERAAEVDALLVVRDSAIQELEHRIQRSSDTHRQLMAANRELTDTNALLRTSNDELLLSNEEVQAATEEVETLNEELQATNEELETLNEELQATIEELNSTNAQLEARTADIEEANEALAGQRERTDRERQRLATTMASMDDAVMMVDQDGTSLVTNHAYDALFAGAEGASVLEVEGGEPMPSRRALQERAAAGEAFATQFALRAPDGSRRWFEAIGRPLRGGDDRGGVVVIRDITDRSLRELQDQFVAMVAHELRTPLTAMSGYVELLRRHLPAGDDDNDRLRRFADKAVGQARRMSDLVGDLLDANRLQRGGLGYDVAQVDLSALVEEMVDITQPLADGIEIRLTGATHPIVVSGDAGRLQQVLLNLLSNARHHGGSGGRIDVSLRRRARKAELSVRDHGPGIPAVDLPNLFTRFYQAGEDGRKGGGGLGLGLFISREIVEAHGGTVQAQSRDGEGATFVVKLPIVQEPSPAGGTRRARTGRSGS